jgi:hypothetical protein
MPSRTYNELRTLILPFCNASDHVQFRTESETASAEVEMAIVTFCTDQTRKASVVSFKVFLDCTYRVGQSTCVPTQGSREILKAYARANVFLAKLDLEPKV